MARSRSFTVISAPAATAVYLANGATDTSGNINRFKQCIDVIDGTRNPHPLSISGYDLWNYSLMGYSRPDSVGNFRWKYNGYSSLGQQSHLSPNTGEPSDNTSLSTMLARTNPNKPVTDLPLFLFELKDIPHLLRSWSDDIKSARSFLRKPAVDVRNIPRRLGEKNLEWQFGVAPFIGDLVKIIKFQQSVEQKLNQLRNLQDGGSLGGKAVVWTDVATSAYIGPFYCTGLYQEINTIRFKLETTREKWGTCVWIPTVQLPPKTDQENMLLATRLAYGLDISFNTLWNAMPWSWLVDWFSNMGDIFSLYRNTVPVRHDGSCIMLQTVTRAIAWEQVSGDGPIGLVGNSNPRATNKTRIVAGSATPLPEFNLPFLNGKQLSILASLAVTRRVPTS